MASILKGVIFLIVSQYGVKKIFQLGKSQPFSKDKVKKLFLFIKKNKIIFNMKPKNKKNRETNKNIVYFEVPRLNNRENISKNTGNIK